MIIARYTTPSFTFTPTAVSAEDITDIRLVIGDITKTEADAEIVDGAFVWNFTQAETGQFQSGKTLEVKIDYVTDSGKRYTTERRYASITDSAVNEVI